MVPPPFIEISHVLDPIVNQKRRRKDSWDSIESIDNIGDDYLDKFEEKQADRNNENIKSAGKDNTHVEIET